MESKLTWIEGMQFEARNRIHHSRFDVSLDQGGSDLAPTPKEVLLNAMCACSGMDVISIAVKMRLKLTSFHMEASAEKTKTIPSYFASAHMKYFLEGDDLDQEKVIRLVTLSMTKYCGVSYMVSKTTTLTYDITLNGQLIHQDTAAFSLEVIA